ncbi:MAG: hypothetical protein IJS68_02295 [Clostridia bacterium]|nr:hypothetical protein [Clostridia bacterium]
MEGKKKASAEYINWKVTTQQKDIDYLRRQNTMLKHRIDELMQNKSQEERTR